METGNDVADNMLIMCQHALVFTAAMHAAVGNYC